MCDIWGIAKQKPRPENVCHICKCAEFPNCTEGEGDEQEMCYNCICKFSGNHFGNFDTSSDEDTEADDNQDEGDEKSDNDDDQDDGDEKSDKNNDQDKGDENSDNDDDPDKGAGKK